MTMQQSQWSGVFPAITTPFHDDGSVDHDALAAHVRWLADAGCAGIVTGGSLGEAATLTFDEKASINATCVRAIDGRIPVVAGIAGLATAECVSLARAAERAGCDGLMALPAYVYYSDWRETREHYGAIIAATRLSCMLYNNPVAYRTDVRAEQLAELAQRYDNLHAVKESSGDVRRVTAVREVLGDRLAVFAGLDDMLLEATAIYHWFLPLLRMDTVPKFVQLIKLVQAQVGRGRETVRAPRLVLEGDERREALALIADRLATRPVLEPSHAPRAGEGGDSRAARATPASSAR